MATLDDLKGILESIDRSMIEQKDLLANMITMQETRDRLTTPDTTVLTDAPQTSTAPSALQTMGNAAAGGAGAGLGAAAGLMGLGAGVAGFMAALSLGSQGLEWLGNDYSGLGDAFASFSDAMENLSPAAIAAIAGASVIAAGTSSLKNLYGLGTASGMAGLGAGISGFLVGLALGDVGLGWIDNDYSNLGSALASFSDAISNLSMEAVGLIGGIAGIAVANTALGGNPKTLAMSMTGLAAGIAGFLGGLVLTDIGLDWITNISGADGSGLTAALELFNSSISVLSPASILALGGMLAVASKIPINPLSIAKNMFGISAGIAGFLSGLVLADKGISWIDSIPSGSGEGIVSAFKLFNDAVLALSPEAMTALGVLMAAGAALGATGAGAAGIAVGLPAIGVGIAGFMAALAAGDGITQLIAMGTGGEPGEGLKTLFTNVFQGVAAAKELDGVDLLGLGVGLTAVATGLAAFGVGSIISGLGQATAAIIEFFTGESAFDQIMKIADNADELVKGGEALNTITAALSKFADIKISAIDIDFEKLATDLGRAVPFLDALANGGPVEGSGSWWGGEDINFPKGLLDPSLKLDEMAAAIANVNYVLGRTSENPAVSIRESAAGAVAESPIVSGGAARIRLENEAAAINRAQAQTESLSTSSSRQGSTNVVDARTQNVNNTNVGGTTHTTIITPRSSSDLDYGLPNTAR